MLIGIIATMTLLALAAAWISTPLVPQLIGRSISSVSTHEKVVALTYDDGPDPLATPSVLDLLKHHNILATFFLIGNRIQQHPELTQKIWQAGHQVGNHSWSHTFMMFKSSLFIKKEIEQTDTLLHALGYPEKTYFRSPYGMKLLLVPRVLKNIHKTNILFNIVSYDFKNPGVEKIVKNVLTSVRPGSIILLHDGVGNQKDTLAATDIIINNLKTQGYRFVTVSQLLTYDKKHHPILTSSL